MKYTQVVHPLGKNANVLLSGVFGPYAQDDCYGSRKINPMELYQNQVTRVQGGFSLRMFHRSFGLMMIQANIQAPCTLLDFPTLERFTDEIRTKSYDIIGISAIVPNIGKVVKMCGLIRQFQPDAKIVIGGHITGKAGITDVIDADYIVRGDGIRWFRNYLGENPDAPVRHPLMHSAFGTRIMGHSLRDAPGDTAAILIPSVGCPVGCNFCSTSALFGGKGHFINFYETGDDLFQVMTHMEEKLKARSFFVLDENFLLHRKRALRLLELMQIHQKSWALSVFSSARVIQSYTVEQLVDLGINWVWMGIEGENSDYRKLRDTDTLKLVDTLQFHGIRVLGSSIIGLENHTPRNIDDIISYAVSHKSVFHQFMLYTPNPGTPLYEKHRKDGTLFSESEFPHADGHGQYRFNYRHPHFHDGVEEQILIRAFQRDFEENGPSLFRLIQTMLNSWRRYKNHPDIRVRRRIEWESAPLRGTYAGAVWAMRKIFQTDPVMSAGTDVLLTDLFREFGWKTRILTPVVGRYIYRKYRNEEARLSAGWTYEPDCFYEKNAAAMAISSGLPHPVRETERAVCDPTSAVSAVR